MKFGRAPATTIAFGNVWPRFAVVIDLDGN